MNLNLRVQGARHHDLWTGVGCELVYAVCTVQLVVYDPSLDCGASKECWSTHCTKECWSTHCQLARRAPFLPPTHTASIARSPTPSFDRTIGGNAVLTRRRHVLSACFRRASFAAADEMCYRDGPGFATSGCDPRLKRGRGCISGSLAAHVESLVNKWCPC